MLKKIKRDICLIKYRNLPLFDYDKKNDTEIYYYPKYKFLYWIKLENNSSKNLISKLIKLIVKLKIDNLIFFDGYNKPWISKFISKRKDYKPLIKTLEYFKLYKISKQFNGGILINTKKLKHFFPHFYTITKCDSEFSDCYFMDEKQSIVFHLHYSGEIKVLILNKKINKKFLKRVKEVKFMGFFPRKYR